MSRPHRLRAVNPIVSLIGSKRFDCTFVIIAGKFAEIESGPEKQQIVTYGINGESSDGG